VHVTRNGIDFTTLVNIAAKRLKESRRKVVNERAKGLREAGILSRSITSHFGAVCHVVMYFNPIQYLKPSSDSQILFFSVYIPSIPLYTDGEASAELALTAIQNTITTALRDDQRSTSIVLGGDFNRYHLMWGSNHIQL
jgi:hypothetical protein